MDIADEQKIDLVDEEEDDDEIAQTRWARAPPLRSSIHSHPIIHYLSTTPSLRP